MKDLINKVRTLRQEIETGRKVDVIEISIELINIESEIKAINYTHCCETLNDGGQATLTEYATELINIQEKPQDSNRDWKIVVIQNTIGKLHETLQKL